jgi:hypothetical protein
MKNRLLVVFFSLLILSACAPSPKLIEHPAPDLNVDTSYFDDLNCFVDYECYKRLPQDLGFQVFAVEKPSRYLGALTPRYPMAKSLTYSFEHDPTIPAVYTGECAATVSINYLIYKDGQVQALDSKAEMHAEFAPIDSLKKH